MLIAIGLAYGLIALIALINPRWGLYIFWLSSWLYPASLLYGTLPLNIHFDDLLIIWIAVICLFLPSRSGLTVPSFRMGFLWFLSILLGCTVGILTSPPVYITPILKSLGKPFHIPLLIFTTNSVVRTDQEGKRMLGMILLAMTLGFALDLVQIRRPDLTKAWETPSDRLEKLTYSENVREEDEETLRAGNVTGGNTGALAFSMAIIGLRMLVHLPSWRSKLLSAAGAVYGMIVLGYTVERGAITGFAVSLLYSFFAYSRRTMTVVVVAIGLMGVLSTTDIGPRLWHRLVGERGQVRLDESVEVRKSIWRIYLDEPSIHYMLFGRGFTAEYVRHNASAHSSYIGAFAYTGIFGAIILGWLWYRIWRLGGQLAKFDPEPYGRALGEALVMILIAMIVQGVAGEFWQNAQPFLFTLIALVDIRSRLNLETESMRLSPGFQAPRAW